MTQQLGKYQLIKKLATGGMAEVWLAQERTRGDAARYVVLKRILPHLAEDPEFVQMFTNEYRLSFRFSHPNIAQIYDVGELDGIHYIAMEYIHGEDLGRVMRKAWNTGQWIARPLAIRIVAAACEGLYYAHTRSDDSGRPLKVVHRDVSPQNILISFDGSVKLVDFGIAKAADQSSFTKSGAIKGKFAYMSPEQAAGKVLDHRSDIYSIGLVLYELLTGVRPLKRDSELATLQAALESKIETPSEVADVPEELDSVVMNALARTADDRYRDARVFQMALEEFLVSQRWVATSVQLEELMKTLFADRLEEEKRLGQPFPGNREGAPSGTPMPPLPDWSEQKRLSVPVTTDPGEEKPASKSRRVLPPPDVPGWDAPPGEDVAEPRVESQLRRRPSNPDQATSAGRTPSQEGLRPRPKSETRLAPVSATPSRGEGRSEETRGGTGLLLRRSPSDSEQPLSRTTEPLPVPDDELGDLEAGGLPADSARKEEAGTLPPSSSSASQVRRLGSMSPSARSGLLSRGNEMPEAPAPLLRQPLPEVPEDEDSGQRAPGKQKRPPERAPKPRLAPDEELVRKARLRRWVGQALGFVAAAAVLTAALVYRERIIEVLASSAQDQGGVYLSIETNQPVQVRIEHHPDHAGSEPVTELGRAPIRKRLGAHLRDTVILYNSQMGIHYRHEIPFGEPGSIISIKKEFRTEDVLLKMKPQHLSGLLITRDGQRVGEYPGPRINLAEGLHRLEISGQALAHSKVVDINVRPGAPNVFEVNLTDALEER